MREPIPYVPQFDYRSFPPERLRAAVLHMRDLGQAFYDLRDLIEQVPDSPQRAAVVEILAERSDFEDDYIEIGFAHLEPDAGFLHHVEKLRTLSPEQQAYVDEFRADFERRLEPLRVEAETLQDQWRRARQAYFRT